MPSDDERTPLLQNHDSGNWWDFGASQDVDLHAQFCRLVGIPPSDGPDVERQAVGPKTLYGRVLHQKSVQRRTYALTAGISNALLLAQVVIGAAVTALGASASSHILITLFGASNTIIAGVVAYLKSRGQPMRARMFKDDLERIVDEIENSEIMWLGITKRMHGYQDIDIDKSVTVRSEVARLTRLYEHAVRSATMNSPELYSGFAAGGESTSAGLRSRPLPTQALTALPAAAPVAAAGPSNPAPADPVVPPLDDIENSPATAPPKPPPKEETKTDGSSTKEPKKDDAPDNDKKDVPAESSKAVSKDDTKSVPNDVSKDKDPEENKAPTKPSTQPDAEAEPATKS